MVKEQEDQSYLPYTRRVVLEHFRDESASLHKLLLESCEYSGLVNHVLKEIMRINVVFVQILISLKTENSLINSLHISVVC